MSDPDLRWFEQLADAGVTSGDAAQPSLDTVRKAARRLERIPVDELAEQRLLRRLEEEGLLDPAPALRRWQWPSLASAAVLMLGLGLLFESELFRSADRSPAGQNVRSLDQAKDLRSAEALSVGEPAPEAPSADALMPVEEPERPTMAAAGSRNSEQARAASERHEPRRQAMEDAARFAKPQAREAKAEGAGDLGRRTQVLQLQEPERAWSALQALITRNTGLQTHHDQSTAVARKLVVSCGSVEECRLLVDWAHHYGGDLEIGIDEIVEIVIEAQE